MEEGAPLLATARTPDSQTELRVNTNPRDNKTAKVLLTCGLLVGAMAVAGVHSVTRSSAASSQNQLAAESDESDSLLSKPSLVLTNAYEREQGRLGDGLYRWEHLVEVWQPTELKASGPAVDAGTCEFKWEFPEATAEVLESLGSDASLKFHSVGYHTLQLSLSCDGETVVHEYSVMAKHVRRELRSLSKTDRLRFFDTLSYVYSVSQEDGAKMHGAKYRSIHRLVADHLKGAADKECDHWHDDAGIMTHHIAFTLQMEQSLQSVHPEVTIPYWDYTIDDYLYPDWVKSEVFDDEWFGPANPSNEDHAIDSGRWAFTKVGTQANRDDIVNPYGLLRSPWNTNPVPYIMRHRYVYGEKDGGWKIPSCTSFADAWEDYNTMGDFFQLLNGELHGPVHIMLGGQWWVNKSAGVNFTLTDGGDFLLASKWLWRQGYLRCPETCSDDTPAEHCVCSCPSELRTHFNSSREFLIGTGMFNLSNGLFNDYMFWKSATHCRTEEDCYDTVVKALCHVGHAGEMFTSAAPYDPTFWPIHGLADRYLQLRRLRKSEGKAPLLEKWEYAHDGSSPSDTVHVCDWSAVEAGSMSMPTCTYGDCAGHRRDDLLPMGNFLGTGDRYTNWEFWEFMAPDNDDLPYVYDNFFKWPACSAQGETFWNKF